MKNILFLFLTMVFIHESDCQMLHPVNVGLISEGLSISEKSGVESFLNDMPGSMFSHVSIQKLNQKDLYKKGITEIWWMKDSEEITDAESKVGKELAKFVSEGGHLILSMEAVRLLNKWGIEKNRFNVREDSVLDRGFGRPLGFHGYQAHPVFAGLHGGVYIWKGEKDNLVRKIGFFGNNLPDTSFCKVLGIGWSYITFHEDEKLLLEYKLGKGTIIAVGAYSYFSRPNLNREELYRFYQNIFNYLAGNNKGIKEGYWKYDSKKVVSCNSKTESVKITSSTKWKLPELSLHLDRKEGGDNFVNLTGRRILLMGKEQGGIDEIWTHPFMAFRDVLAAVQVNGSDSLIWLHKMKPEIIVSPEMLIRKYRIESDTLIEVTTVAFDKPMGVVHYEWTGYKIRKLHVKFTSNLRMMWPYSDSSSPVMTYQWSGPLNAALIRNEHAGSESLIGFSMQPAQFKLGRYNNFSTSGNAVQGESTDLLQVSGFFSFDAKTANQKLNIYLGGTDRQEGDIITMYKKAMPGFNDLYTQSSLYYKKLLASKLTIETPDKEFNEGYRWALVRTDQFLQTTPGIGTSMMAGFGTTSRGWDGGQRVSGRPGYAWYFGRDGEWTAMALNAMGSQNETRQVLDMFVKYQAVNGKILHELTSSGAVHYDAADATPLFVVLAGHYLKYSGDLEFIKKIWPAIMKAMDYCYSTDTDGDGLIENTNVGHGWIEGGPLFGTHTEFYMAGTWAAALDEAAYMCKHIGNEKLMNQYTSDALLVKQIIDKNFWSEKERHFFNGKMADGSFMTDATVLQSVPVLLNTVTDSQKASDAVGAFANDNFSTGWGLRMIPDDNPKFNPGSYHSGMVWPLFTGYASLAEYKTGHYHSGFRHMMNNISGYHSWALGSIAETLNGKVYKPNGVCYLQAWSETMCLQPAIEGMLGLKPDAMDNRLQLTPSFPWEWEFASVKNIRIKNALMHLKMKRTSGLTTYFINTDKPVYIDFNHVWPPDDPVKSVTINGKSSSWKLSEKPQGQSLRISFKIEPGESKIEIETKY